MAVKTITVTEEAYQAIKRLKTEQESFSELFLRLSTRSLTARDLRGILKHTPEEAEEFRRRVREVHERLGRDIQERVEHVRTRFKHAH